MAPEVPLRQMSCQKMRPRAYSLQPQNIEATKKIKIHKGQLILCAMLHLNVNWEIKTWSLISSSLFGKHIQDIKEKKNYKMKRATIE